MNVGVPITTISELTEAQGSRIRALVAAAEAHDGFSALNEEARLSLRHHRPGVVHLLAERHRELAGYGQLRGGAEFTTGELVVEPDGRRSGIGAELLATMVTLSVSHLQIWAMGDSDAARGLATSAGFTRARELLIMKRDLDQPIPEPVVPAGVEIRTFEVGRDEDAWLEVNARAFAHHPEQGQLGRADLDARMSEPWFSRDGFFVAVRNERLVGFHWTKQHGHALGEVYVLGVDPDAAGGGLGKALLITGLKHLRSSGDSAVLLYVEADYERAVGLYTGYGFSVVNRDVMYAQAALVTDHAP